MDVRRAYCSAVDRNVPVVFRAGLPTVDARAAHDPSDLVCLDYRVRCTGWCCPLMSVDDDRAVVGPRPVAEEARPGDRHAVPDSTLRRTE